MNLFFAAQNSGCKISLLPTASKVAVTHSLPAADTNFSMPPSSSKSMNSFSLVPLHHPNEFGHLSEDADVQKEVPEETFKPFGYTISLHARLLYQQ
jgi:hypothetical protein